MGQIAVVPVRGRTRRRRASAVLAGLALAAAGTSLLVAPAEAASSSGRIYIIQGISGQDLDVKVDGKTVMADAKPKSIIGPLKLDAGSHEVVVGDIKSDVSVKAGESADVVAHPATTAQDPPEITAFKNDVGSVGPGKVRLTVAHTAAAPPADIRVNGDVLFSNVANAEALTVVVPAATYKVEVVPAATEGDPILGPVDLTIKAGTLTRVFAIGDVSKGSMDAVVHVVPISVKGAGAPGSVQTGDGGQAANEFTSDRSPWALGAVLLLIIFGAVAVARGSVFRSR
jgi:hypothetical protein